MADQKLSQITALTSVATNDIMYIVDVSDVSGGASGTSKNVTVANATALKASSGANSDITSLTGLTTPLSVAQGGTSVTTKTGTGSVVLSSGPGITNAVLTTPSMTSPSLGAATAVTINKITITAPAAGATLTLTDGKTLAVTNTLTLSGTDSTVMTFPTTTATIARTDAAQTFTGTQTFSQVLTTNNAIVASSNAATVPITSRINTVTNSSAATLTITMTTTSAVDGQLSIVRILDFSAVAQTITWVNTENSTVTAPTTSNGSTTLPLTAGFQYNSSTSKWRCIASA